MTINIASKLLREPKSRPVDESQTTATANVGEAVDYTEQYEADYYYYAYKDAKC
jgi:hypothetical protein